MRLLIAVFVAVPLVGCSGPPQPGRGELFMNADQITAKDDAICKGYGAQPGTPAYINCRGQQDQRRTTFLTAD